MRIAVVCYPTYGGSGVVATELGFQLAQRGHKIHFVSYAMPFRLSHPFSENIFFHQVDQHEYPLFEQPLYTLSLSVKLQQLIYLEQLDLIHIHYAIPHAVSAFLAKQMVNPRPIGVVTTLHGTDITLVGQEPSYKSIVKFSIEQSDAVTAVSNWLRDETIRDFDVTRPIDVIPNFFDCRRVEADVTASCRDHYAEEDEKIILHVSNFRPVKCIPDVIQIFSRIAEKIPAKLLLIGDGPDRDTALQLARDLGVMNRIWYLGKQDIVEPFFAIADLLLFPSHHESFGLAALEAMAFGVPVVTSNSGGLPELIKDGVNGALAPAGDVETMAKKAIRILTDSTLYDEISRNARKKVEDHYQPEQIVDRYEDIYNRVLDSAAVHM